MVMLIALIPALAWGSVGLVNTKMGGSAGQQTLGMTFGALLFGMGTLLFYVIPNHFTNDWKIWLVGFVSGVFWTIGTAGQFVGFKNMGVSGALPLSTAGQIIGNALLGATILGLWNTAQLWVVGSISIALVTIGALLTAAKPKGTKEARSENYIKGLYAVGISTIGYMLYFIFPNLMTHMGFISEAVKNDHNGLAYMTAIVGPQAIGQVIGGFVIILLIFKEANLMFEKHTWKNILTGLVWGLGNLFMFISAGNPEVGQVVAATLSQMGVLVGTFGGIWILHEKKTSDQMVKIIIGAILVVIGGIMIGKLDTIISWLSSTF